MEYLNFIFRDFWTFIGCFMLIALPFQFAFLFWNRFWRHWNIRIHGYPPAHCDADGDFKQEKEKSKK